MRHALLALFSFALLAVLPGGVREAHAQAAEDLTAVHKIFLAPLKGDFGSRPLRQELASRLKSEGKYEIVDAPGQADAILTGTCQLWITGHVSVNPRNPSSNAQPNYAGYLSLELAGKNHEPLWSYLAVPTRFTVESITTNLVKNAITALLQARSETAPSSAVSSQSFAGSHIVLHGAGASFPAPLYGSWIASFHKAHPEIDIAYNAVGSEAGTTMLAEGKVDFAASELMPSAEPFLRLASVMGSVVPIYNLKTTAPYLRFTPEALAGIYLGRITRWNDPAIRASNRGVHLPDAAIVVIHRSDGSGTTFTWSRFLSKTSDAWKDAVGSGATLKWPVGEGEPLNEGVASRVASTPNSIGYVELVYAIQHQLSFGAVKNRAGTYIHADLNSLHEAAKSATAGPESIIDAPGAGAYPITAFTWILLPPKEADAKKRKALLTFLEWVLTSGQRSCSALAYAPLPNEIAARELEQLHHLQ
ncbi:MAG TPA: phosphate ABC transporter substrate-binding protein PstS [Acidobacteriaceae bacterium]|jgi:phosphate transport system substrate-binding protein